MIQQVTDIFNARIKEKFAVKNEHVFRFLYNHERKDVCIGKICEQIKLVEKRLYSITFNADVYRSVIENMCDFFCLQALNHAEQQAMTSAERQRRIDESEYFDQIGEEIKEIEQSEAKRENTPTSFLNEIQK